MSKLIEVADGYGYRHVPGGYERCYRGEVELDIKDVSGRTIQRIRENNLIKIFAKEILSHRLSYSKIWDPNANAGVGAWVSSGIDIDEFAAKYIVLGASFDAQGNALDTADTRFYTPDAVSGGFIPITLGPGAAYDGGLINAVPISEPTRPLKRIERVYFESSYQPAGTPLLQSDVRAMNNVVVFETTLRKDEYNGFARSPSDFLTLTEVALVGARELDTALGACECNPRDIFLTGDSDNDAILCNTSGTATISIDPSQSEVDVIKVGDQIKIVAVESGAFSSATFGAPDGSPAFDQLNPYYLVINKALGGRDITLDRTPVDANNKPITVKVGVLRDGFRIFSHRVLSSPVKKSSVFEITVRWRIILN